MGQKVRELMTSAPVTVRPDAPVGQVAQLMRQEGVGTVIVAQGEELRGLVTDRDLVVRVLAAGKGPDTQVSAACSEDIVGVSPQDEVSKAAELMRSRSVRRLPVVEDDKVVGIVSLGDLAIERDEESALGQISAASPNR